MTRPNVYISQHHPDYRTIVGKKEKKKDSGPPPTGYLRWRPYLEILAAVVIATWPVALVIRPGSLDGWSIWLGIASWVGASLALFAAHRGQSERLALLALVLFGAALAFLAFAYISSVL